VPEGGVVEKIGIKGGGGGRGGTVGFFFRGGGGGAGFFFSFPKCTHPLHGPL